jgi:hypothetical protein
MPGVALSFLGPSFRTFSAFLSIWTPSPTLLGPPLHVQNSPPQENKRATKSPVPQPNDQTATMALATGCAHIFKMIKSDSTLIQWHCNLCHSGPHWWIFECRYCKIHTCRSCTQSA